MEGGIFSCQINLVSFNMNGYSWVIVLGDVIKVGQDMKYRVLLKF